MDEPNNSSPRPIQMGEYLALRIIYLDLSVATADFDSVLKDVDRARNWVVAYIVLRRS